MHVLAHVRTHTHEVRGIEAKTLGKDMQYPSFSLQETRQRDKIKGDFSEVEYERSTEWSLDG